MYTANDPGVARNAAPGHHRGIPGRIHHLFEFNYETSQLLLNGHSTAASLNLVPADSCQGGWDFSSRGSWWD